jgi:hypothetical protein
MTFDPTKTIEQLGLVAATANLSAREAKMAYAGEVFHQLRGWVGKDAAREDAAAALDVWVRRHALDDEIRDRVLANFDPRREPQAGKDFLPEVPLAQRFPSADELRGYIGRWVAVVAGKVIWSTETLPAMLGHLEREGITAHSTFQVPAKASEDAYQTSLKVLDRSVSCTYGCFGGNNDFDCPVHGGMREVRS